MYSEFTHLDAIALCLYHAWIASNNVVVVLNLADFYVKASLSNKSEQKLKSSNRHGGSTRSFDLRLYRLAKPQINGEGLH